MPRYIDADKIPYRFYAGDELLARKDVIDQMPTLSPDEVRGVGEITDDDACPSCGCWIPTDDAHDAIFKNEVKFCYYCGMRLRMKGAEDGTTDNT